MDMQHHPHENIMSCRGRMPLVKTSYVSPNKIDGWLTSNAQTSNDINNSYSFCYDDDGVQSSTSTMYRTKRSLKGSTYSSHSLANRCHPHKKVYPSHHVEQHFHQIPADMKSMTPTKSQAISLPSSHITRTESELQLCDDTAAAEWRDYCMFHRLVSGIRDKQAKRLHQRATSQQIGECDRKIEQSIASIVKHRQEDLTRHKELNVPPSYTHDVELDFSTPHLDDTDKAYFHADHDEDDEMFSMDL